VIIAASENYGKIHQGIIPKEHAKPNASLWAVFRLGGRIISW
jgi:hypothetical protein